MQKQPLLRNFLGPALILIMLASTLSPILTVDLASFDIQETVHRDVDFSESNDFIHTNLSANNQSGEIFMDRPQINFQATTGNGLMVLRTGACSVYVPEFNEIWLMGGRQDPNPQNNADEGPTTLVESFDLSTKKWDPQPLALNTTQQYAGCAKIGDKIFLAGDHHPNSNPEIRAGGILQSYNLSSGNWTVETPMPLGKRVGLAGVAALDGYLYVSGGVERIARNDPHDQLLRYDPSTDNWTQMADMNVERFDHQMVAFHGKLYAIGGKARFFDAAQNKTVLADSNLTEVYDPQTNTWTNLTNLSVTLVGHAATVFNDEIIILGGYTTTGWSGSASKKMYGFNPVEQTWRTYGQMQMGFYDTALAAGNGTLVYASGDASSYRFGTWNQMYLADTEYFSNPAKQIGWLTSGVIDLRYGTQGSASPLWMTAAGSSPATTDLGIQYRSASDSVGVSSTSWLPSGPNSSNLYFETLGNSSLDETPTNTPFFQYRIVLEATDLDNWTTPEIDSILIESETASITSSIPQVMNPNANTVTLATQHHAYSADPTYEIAIHAADELGYPASGSSWTTISWNETWQSHQVNDPDGLLLASDTAVQIGGLTDEGRFMNWTFAITDGIATDSLLVRVSTSGIVETSYTHINTISIDNEVSVNMTDVKADFDTEGNDTLVNGETVPGLTQLDVSFESWFTNSGQQLTDGEIRVRINYDVLTANTTDEGHEIWDNTSTSWFNLVPGQTNTVQFTIPEDAAGNAILWFESATDDDFTLNIADTSINFTVNVEAPILTSVSPDQGTYLNQKSDRVVEFQYWDVGGFSTDTITTKLWLEDVHDGTNGGSLDGIAQADEYVEIVGTISNIGNFWMISLVIDDTGNDDHSMARVTIEGKDLAGFDLPQSDTTNGDAYWKTREAAIPVIEEFTALSPEAPEIGVRIEPTRTVGWKVVASDSNTLEDITEIILEFGGDSNLGVKYTPLDSTCSSLDSRMIVNNSDCVFTNDGDSISIEFWLTADWSMTNLGLIGGVLDVVVRDYDGAVRESHSGMWNLDRGLEVEIDTVEDITGIYTGEITSASVLMTNDRIQITADVSHPSSLAPYQGTLTVKWEGMIQNERWTGSLITDVVDGELVLDFPVPSSSGLINQAELTIWDPLGVNQLAATPLPDFVIDGDAPILLDSSMTSGISRYHLDQVEIGVNIDEPQQFSSELDLTCQVRSLTVTWPAQTISKRATTVYDGRTMFSFVYDFSQSGDPSMLPDQAYIACWAQGMDDAGWNLTAEGDNSETTPWLESQLNDIGPDLSLGIVTVTGSGEAGSKLKVKAQMANMGERISTPFNISVFVEQDGEREIVGRQIVQSIGEQESTYIYSSVTVPEGDWTLIIQVDSEELIWELDEENNIYTEDFTTAGSEGMNVMMLAGIGLVVVAVGFVIMRRRGDGVATDELVQAAAGPTGGPPSGPSGAPPKKGPPGGAKAASGPTTAPPTKGPPGRAPAKEVPQITDTVQAAAANFAALDAITPSVEETKPVIDGQSAETPAQEKGVGTTVSDYQGLPGGGEYDYTAEGTFYAGDNIGKWQLNEDNSFTRIE